jgi:hypothetical protein
MVYGEPITVARGADFDEHLCAQVTAALAAAEDRAWELVSRR